jgi:hypothetical protein
LEEDGSISYLPNPSLSKEKSSITQVYYYLPVDEDSNEASNYQTKSSYFEVSFFDCFKQSLEWLFTPTLKFPPKKWNLAI